MAAMAAKTTWFGEAQAMATYMFHAMDRAGMGERRGELREAHRAHIRRADPNCRCVLGGPLRREDGKAMIGTLLIFEADDAASVQAFMAADPYCLAEIFESISILPWSIGLGVIEASP
ncbi:YciI family protein [Novosphingobium humi]|uniref:YciI family protein n=1 Tax=Novosphingobium humi TaxID=2282397 RepID=A0ABY7U348_9SPHN|nr:YciI family protein [Novosphingobium humi]WCT79226.1 YciI family protein [Novosphingobium humi]